MKVIALIIRTVIKFSIFQNSRKCFEMPRARGAVWDYFTESPGRMRGSGIGRAVAVVVERAVIGTLVGHSWWQSLW